ncbi:OmpA family protein [uncultured Nonlabens sp.]|uniref:OmpA family protein n=1 Tax=uncultured Nonlabens sp. TaxID=859306 RepID=UPI002616DA5D|nr:OmpA family protein [uncultured Nonlabens sp.]
MKKLKYPVGIIITIIIGILLTIWLCCGTCYSGNCNDQEKTDSAITVDSDTTSQIKTAPQKERFNGIELFNNNQELIERSNDNLDFNSNDYHHIIPVSDNATNSFKNIKNYLEDNPDTKLNITGLYTSTETNSSAFTNLGEARANDVKNYLTSLGYDNSRMDIYGSLNDEMTASDSIFKGPITYTTALIAKGDAALIENQKLDELKVQIKANPLILHFQTGSNTVKLTATQRKKVSEINYYTNKRPEDRILVIGHSDNVGNRNSNIALSKKRAIEVEKYLIENGLSKSKIETGGKGPDAPIANNKTAEGRAENRRVEITIK